MQESIEHGQVRPGRLFDGGTGMLPFVTRTAGKGSIKVSPLSRAMDLRVWLNRPGHCEFPTTEFDFGVKEP